MSTGGNAGRSMPPAVFGPAASSRVLTQLVSVHEALRCVRSDSGPEYLARAILRWLNAGNIETACIDPGKPRQHAAGESFNRTFRDECRGSRVSSQRARVDGGHRLTGCPASSFPRPTCGTDSPSESRTDPRDTPDNWFQRRNRCYLRRERALPPSVRRQRR